MVINVTGTVVIDIRVRDWCRLPYPGHRKGCPNYGKSEVCPPKVPIVDQVFNLSKETLFVVDTFDLAAHVHRMAMTHPTWSDKQCRCCLYWQNGVRSRLRKLCEYEAAIRPGYSFTMIPEAMGVNVFRTCHRHGLMIRKAAYPIVYKVGLVGMSLRRKDD